MSNPTDRSLNIIKNLKFNTCLDVGANIGQFASEILQINPAVKICSIEPNPHCISRIKKLGVEVIEAGVSNKSGTLELITLKQKPRSKGASFYKETTPGYADDDNLLKIQVPVYTLDELFPNRVFDLIKIDTQGAELDVLEGGPNLIAKSNYVILELPIVEYNKGAPTADLVVKKISSMGFYIQELMEFHYLKSTLVQIDLLFSNSIKEHNTSEIKEFLNILGI